MPIKRYVICDECGRVKAPYSEVSEWQQEISFDKVMDSGEEFVNLSGWEIRAFPDPEDPIVIDAEFFCKNCSSKVSN